jgi:hypothetical protein
MGAKLSVDYEKAYHPLNPETDAKQFVALQTTDPTLHRMLCEQIVPESIEYYFRARYDWNSQEAANARAAIRHVAIARGVYAMFNRVKGPLDADLYTELAPTTGAAAARAKPLIGQSVPAEAPKQEEPIVKQEEQEAPNTSETKTDTKADTKTDIPVVKAAETPDTKAPKAETAIVPLTNGHYHFLTQRTIDVIEWHAQQAVIRMIEYSVPFEVFTAQYVQLRQYMHTGYARCISTAVEYARSDIVALLINDLVIVTKPASSYEIQRSDYLAMTAKLFATAFANGRPVAEIASCLKLLTDYGRITAQEMIGKGCVIEAIAPYF